MDENELREKLGDYRILDREIELRDEREARERDEYEDDLHEEAAQQNSDDLKQIFSPEKLAENRARINAEIDRIVHRAIHPKS